MLTGPTERLPHGVLGDRVEAKGFTLVDTEGDPLVAGGFEVERDAVIEGIAPIWADLTGDGLREIVVTVSDRTAGARVVVFSESGRRMATGPPSGPNGGMEITEVLTPHIGGVVGFYRLEGTALRLVAQLPGFSTHVMGSRNLDMALAGDMDGARTRGAAGADAGQDQTGGHSAYRVRGVRRLDRAGRRHAFHQSGGSRDGRRPVRRRCRQRRQHVARLAARRRLARRGSLARAERASNRTRQGFKKR